MAFYSLCSNMLRENQGNIIDSKIQTNIFDSFNNYYESFFCCKSCTRQYIEQLLAVS